MGAIEAGEEFGKRIYLEAWKRGWSRARKEVVIGDGAEWIWNIVNQHFPVRFRLSIFITPANISGTWPLDLAPKLYPNQQVEQERWMLVHKDALLDEGKIEELVASLRDPISQSGVGRKDPHRGRLL